MGEVSQAGDIQVSCKPGCWLSPLEQIAKLKHTAPSSRGQSICVLGDKVQYFSDSHQCWCPATVIAVGINGEIQVDIKSGYWISRDEQTAKIRSASRSVQNEKKGDLDGLRCPTFRFEETLPASAPAECIDASFGSLSPENLAHHNAAFGSVGRVAGSSSNAACRSDSTVLMASSVAAATLSARSGRESAMSSMRSLIPSATPEVSCSIPGNRVGFEPNVSVTAFKTRTAPDQMHNRGHTFECQLATSVDIPRAWSFSSSSLPSTCSFSSQVLQTPGLTPNAGYSPPLAAIPETPFADHQPSHQASQGSAVLMMPRDAPTMSSLHTIPSTYMAS